MINCMIVDDEQHAVDLLTQHVKQTSFLQLAHATTNPVEAVNILQQQPIDLVFIDMQMPELSGLDVIKAANGKSSFIICTAFPEFALEGYDHDVVDYLLKPVTYARFIKGVSKAMNILSKETRNTPQAGADFIFIKTESKGKLLRISYNEIDYVEGQKNYVAFYSGKEKKLALLNMKFLEETLPASLFVRVHNSYIVPFSNITLIEGNELALKNSPVRIPIGITYKDKLMEALKIKR
ncbi:MAG TPA: LytTR family DNA-binding domain-containing protein [Chitinophagaceae bacterium]|nr:LytTR family DNA-binding domain-containing protein [Chitinophagaceae bacterium]